MEMSGHGLEEGSREGNVAVLEEVGEISESERLRLRAMILRTGGMLIWHLFYSGVVVQRFSVCSTLTVDDGHIWHFGEREMHAKPHTRQ